MGLEGISRRRFTVLAFASGAAVYLGAQAQTPAATEAAPFIQSNHPVDEIQRAITHYGNSPLSFEEANQLLIPASRFFGFLDNSDNYDGSDMLRNTFIVRRVASPADQLVKDYPDIRFTPAELDAVRRYTSIVKGIANTRMFVVLDNNVGHKVSVDQNGKQTIKYDWQFEGEGAFVHCQKHTSAIDLISVAGHENQHFGSARRFMEASTGFADALQRNFPQYNGNQIEFRGFTIRVLDDQGKVTFITSIQNELITDALIKWKSAGYIPYIMAGGATPAVYANLKEILANANIFPEELEKYTRTNETETFYLKLGENNINEGITILPPHKRTVTAGPVRYVDENVTTLPAGIINGCI